jgi:hypothetical protein
MRSSGRLSRAIEIVAEFGTGFLLSLSGRFKAVHQARAATYVTLVQITLTGPIGL